MEQHCLTLIVLISLNLLYTYAPAQERRVSGIVTDSRGNAMPGVNVIVAGTLSGTVTDVEGRYAVTEDHP